MQKGVSTKKKAEVLEELFYIRYSKFTTSRITDITTREILNCSAFPVKVLNLEM
jgi:transposase-like protein